MNVNDVVRQYIEEIASDTDKIINILPKALQDRIAICRERQKKGLSFGQLANKFEMKKDRIEYLCKTCPQL